MHLLNLLKLGLNYEIDQKYVGLKMKENNILSFNFRVPGDLKDEVEAKTRGLEPGEEFNKEGKLLFDDEMEFNRIFMDLNNSLYIVTDEGTELGNLLSLYSGLIVVSKIIYGINGASGCSKLYSSILL